MTGGPENPGGGGPSEPPGRDEPANQTYDWIAERARRGLQPTASDPVRTGGNDGEPPDGADVRIAILETQVAHIQSALGDLRSDLKDVLSKLSHLPTKQDMTNNLLAIVTAGLAVIVIVVGGIIGGLAALEHPAPQVQPIVVQVPSTAPALPAKQ